MRHLSFRVRLFCYSLTFTVLLLTGLTLTIQLQTRSVLTKKASDAISHQFDLLAVNLQQTLDTIHDIGQKIYLNSDILHILSQDHPYRDAYGLYSDTRIPNYSSTLILNEMRLISGVLENYRFSSILDASIYPTLYMLNRPEYNKYKVYPYLADHRSIENTPWYLPLPADAPYSLIPHVSDSNLSSPYVMRYAKRLYGLKKTGIPYGALLTIDFDIEPFCRLLDSLKLTANTQLFILDAEGNVLFSNKLENLRTSQQGATYYSRLRPDTTSSFYTAIDQTPYFVYYKSIPLHSWTLLSLTPVSELTKDSRSLAMAQWLFLGIGVLFSFIISLSFTQDMSRPIEALVSSMKIASEGEFNLQLDYSYGDEFQYLIGQYNTMMNKIHYLVDTLYRTELDKKSAELNALQAQINPHFLYNTLDCIHLTAQQGDRETVSELVLSLADFYRFTLNNGKTYLTFGEERRQIEAYLSIQKLRFKDQLDYHISFDPRTLRFYTLKLLLQPLVENAILHGIQPLFSTTTGSILLTSQLKNGDILIEVIDNGIGCDIEALNLQLTPKSTSQSLGIRNVHHRIQQHFGPEYGLCFFANMPQGVRAQLRLPAKRFMEDDHV